jgi:hypothetical protein
MHYIHIKTYCIGYTDTAVTSECTIYTAKTRPLQHNAWAIDTTAEHTGHTDISVTAEHTDHTYIPI